MGHSYPLLEMQVIALLLMSSHGSNTVVSQLDLSISNVRYSSLLHLASDLYPEVISHLVLGIQGTSPGWG